jgi:tyrosinase
MQWMTVIVISLCWWCEVDADKSLNASECHRRMRADWGDVKKYTPYELTEEDKACLKPDDIEERQSRSYVRKECRTLSDPERIRLWAAFQGLMREPNGGTFSTYNTFVAQHRSSVSPGAHYGSNFPGWHQYYLLMFEIALQRIDPSVCLCYWDSSLDSRLPDSSESAVWTPEYFGNGDGFVTSGPGANLQVALRECASTWPRLYRVSGGNTMLYNANKIGQILNADYSALMRPWASSIFSSYHDQVHASVGGHMAIISCSPLDPAFWFHHCFVDYLWAKFRERNPTLEYPTGDDVPRFHRAGDPMLPFEGRRVIDGFSNNYIPERYSYEDSPSSLRCTSHAQCRSKALWCDSGRCTACVREGGRMGSNWPDRGCYITGCATPRKDGSNRCSCAA